MKPLSPKELAEKLNRSPETIRRAIRTGAIKAVRLNRQYLIPEAEVRRLVEG
jgi:excisionase family DNA binding protein